VVFDVRVSIREVEPFSLSLLRKIFFFIGLKFSVLESEPLRLGSSSWEELEDGNNSFSPSRIHRRVEVVRRSCLAESTVSIPVAGDFVVYMFLSFIELRREVS